jgi:hypothetical protein
MSKKQGVGREELLFDCKIYQKIECFTVTSMRTSKPIELILFSKNFPQNPTKTSDVINEYRRRGIDFLPRREGRINTRCCYFNTSAK